MAGMKIIKTCKTPQVALRAGEPSFRISMRSMEASCEDVSQVLKSLAHPRRLLILGHLTHGPLSVGDLTRLCEISQSQMSHFLTRLSFEGLVKSGKEGKYRIYSIKDERLRNLLEVIQREYCGRKK